MKKIILAAGFLALTGSANCANLIGNLPTGNGAIASNNLSEDRILGIRITINDQNWDLESAQLQLRFNSTAISLGANPILTINADDSGDPGVVLHTFVNPGGYTVGSDLYTFNVNGSFTFQADTTYYLTLKSDLSVGPDWVADNPGTSYTGPATFNGGRFSSDTGSSWNDSLLKNSFQINATEAVPEPITLTCLSLGIAAIVGRKRQKLT